MKKNKIKSFDEYSSNRSNFVNERFVDGEEKEGEVAHSQLKAICDYAMKLSEIILPDDQLPGWVQSKLAVIAHDIDEVFHWIDAKILTAKGTAVYNEYEDDEYEDDEDGNEYEDDEDGNEYEDDEDGNEYEDDDDEN
jgi:hypothetical protein